MIRCGVRSDMTHVGWVNEGGLLLAEVRQYGQRVCVFLELASTALTG